MKTGKRQRRAITGLGMANKLYIVHDPRFHSMIRPVGDENRIKETDPRWSQPRFLERIEQYVETELLEVWKNPPQDAKVVWFALPDPQAPDVIKHYEHWSKNFNGVAINHPNNG